MNGPPFFDVVFHHKQSISVAWGERVKPGLSIRAVNTWDRVTDAVTASQVAPIPRHHSRVVEEVLLAQAVAGPQALPALVDVVVAILGGSRDGARHFVLRIALGPPVEPGGDA